MHESGSLWTNYAGFERSEWVVRTDENHRQSCKEIMVHFQKHGTKTAHEDAESQRGLRHSILLELPYFNPICYVYGYGIRLYVMLCLTQCTIFFWVLVSM